MPEKKKKDVKTPEEMTFEEAEERLSEIVEKLEEGDGKLDEMLKLYEEGTALLRRPNALLQDAEERVKKIGAGGEETPFDV